MQRLPCSVAIIAGGQSKRFGSPKYQAKIGDLRLIDFSLHLARDLSSEIMIISGLPEIRQAFTLPVFDDVFPQCGPLGGIHSALLHGTRDWLAVLPVDMPLLKSEFYHTLWENRRGNVPLVAKTAKGIEPMVSLWPRTVLPAIERALSGGRFKIHELLEKLSAVQVFFSPEDTIHFFNVNFRDDLERMQELLLRSRP